MERLSFWNTAAILSLGSYAEGGCSIPNPPENECAGVLAGAHEAPGTATAPLDISGGGISNSDMSYAFDPATKKLLTDAPPRGAALSTLFFDHIPLEDLGDDDDPITEDGVDVDAPTQRTP